MDLNTGKTYPSIEAALKDGVSESDVVHISGSKENPKLKFSKGSFKKVTK